MTDEERAERIAQALRLHARWADAFCRARNLELVLEIALSTLPECDRQALEARWEQRMDWMEAVVEIGSPETPSPIGAPN